MLNLYSIVNYVHELGVFDLNLFCLLYNASESFQQFHQPLDEFGAMLGMLVFVNSTTNAKHKVKLCWNLIVNGERHITVVPQSLFFELKS
jgi:hypothetical protein